MMTRAAVIAAILIQGGFTEARTSMTIVETTTRTYPGFRARLTYQIGCATTGDYPSEETVKAAQADQARRLNEMEPACKRAFEFFSKGDHPFTRFRRFLTDEKSGVEAGTIFWQDAQLSLFVRSETPEVVRLKLTFDFVLSLPFDPELKRTTPFARPPDPKARLYDVTTFHDWVSKLVAHACRQPEALRGWAATPIDGKQMGNQYGYDEAHRLIKAKALQRVLDRKPYGDDLLTEARWLDKNSAARELVLLSSDVQSAELKTVLAPLAAFPEVMKYYEPLF
jgi:hypothetical protein